MIFLPVSKTMKLKMAQHAITAAIGNALSVVKKLTIAELREPMPSWIAPSNAEALPAFLLKGAIDNADELGKVNPWQLKKIRIKNIVENKPTKW